MPVEPSGQSYLRLPDFSTGADRPMKLSKNFKTHKSAPAPLTATFEGKKFIVPLVPEDTPLSAAPSSRAPWTSAWA